MKRISFLMLLFISTTCYSQLKYIDNYEFGISVGYNNITEPIMWEANYKPISRDPLRIGNSPFSIGAGFGWQWVERIFVFADVGWYPFKESRLRPYVGVDYILMTGENVQSTDNTENFDVRPDSYLNPYLGLRFKIKKDGHSYIRLKAGYAQLLNSPVVNEYWGTQNWYDYLQSLNKSNFTISIGIVGSF
jgi:hypothetical protein